MFASDEVVNSLSGDEALPSSDDDDDDIEPTSRPRQRRQRSTQQPRSSVAPSTPLLPSPPPQDPSLSIPSQIWKERWVPPSGRYSGLFLLPAAIADSAYDVATSGVHYDELEVRGADVSDLAVQLKSMIKAAVDRRDFTELLTPEREFYV